MRDAPEPPALSRCLRMIVCVERVDLCPDRHFPARGLADPSERDDDLASVGAARFEAAHLGVTRRHVQRRLPTICSDSN